MVQFFMNENQNRDNLVELLDQNLNPGAAGLDQMVQNSLKLAITLL